MSKLKIIFCDTNIVFGLFHRIVQDLPIFYSALFLLATNHDVYIDEYVLDEIERNFHKKYGVYLTGEHIKKFFELSNFTLIPLHDIQTETLLLVKDFDDAQILQDALAIKADFLLTKNIIDFDIESIYKLHECKVVANIPAELLSYPQ